MFAKLWTALYSYSWPVIETFLSFVNIVMFEPFFDFLKGIYDKIGLTKIPLIGDFLDWYLGLLDKIFTINGVQLSFFSFLFVSGVGFYIAWTILRWIIGLVTGA